VTAVHRDQDRLQTDRSRHAGGSDEGVLGYLPAPTCPCEGRAASGSWSRRTST